MTRSPSLAIPSSFSSLRCGQSARQNARAILSVSRLCSAESDIPPLGWSPFCRKNTCTKHSDKCKRKKRQFQIDFKCYFYHCTYFCPPDNLPVFFVFWFLEYLCTADGLHGFSIDGAYNSGEEITCTKNLLHWNYLVWIFVCGTKLDTIGLKGLMITYLKW